MRIAGIELPELMSQAVRSCRRHYLAAAGFSLLINLLYLTPAIYMLQVYDRVVPTGGKLTLFFVTLVLAFALITLAGLDAIRNRLLVRASARLDTILSPIILARILSVDDRGQVQAMRDLDTIRQTVASPASTGILDLPWAPIFIIVCFLLHFWIGILAVGSVILLVALAWRHQRTTRPAIEMASRAIAASHMAEQRAAARSDVVRGLGMVGAMVDRQLAQRSTGIGTMAEAQFAGSRFTASSRFLRLFVQSAALGLGALLAITGQISAGAIIAGSILLGRALQPIDSLIGGWSSLMSSWAALRRLADTLSQPIDAERVRTALPAPEGKLEVDQLGVRGEGGRPILLGVSFAANPGEILGIIGPSGSGKTTIAKLVVGAMAADAGTIRIDGAQRSDWNSDELGRHVGYLPQEPSLFEGTVKENIARFRRPYDGDPESIDRAVIAAAKAAGVHELILHLPEGYDTRLGPLGTGLSAGQAQRVALARALFDDPVLLVLDEPNAFLDADGEMALVQSLKALRDQKKTILLIAHRRSVMQDADRLLVLDGGRPKLLGPAKEVAARLAGGGTENAA